MRCFVCDKGKFKIGQACMEREFRDKKYKVQSSAMVCSHCEYALVEGSDLPEVMPKLADAYRLDHGLLTSNDIKQRRAALAMSQSRFATWLGVGVATVKRIEMGQVQDSSTDQLIRIRTDPHAARQNAVEVAQKLSNQSA